MASSSSLLSEEQFLCSICLDVFNEPVSTSCGHNFCIACVTKYWDSNDLEVVENVKRMTDEGKDDCLANPGKVACDVCTGTKLKALKSCLVCLASYCETHLEPHQIAPPLKRHKLIDPVENLEDRICKKHDRVLELFCRTDQTCVCQFCTETDHNTHDTVPIDEECGERKAQLGKTEEELQQIIQERLQKLKDIKHSVELSKRDAKREIADSMQKQKAAERQAEGLIKELEHEITELKRRSTELEQLSHTEDHLQLLQSFTSLVCTPPSTKDWSEISEMLNKEMEKLLPEVKLKRIQQYAVDVTLDPDTAHPYLILSEDGKQVRCGETVRNLPDNPKRFDRFAIVLGKDCFSSGRFYCEMTVKGKTKWTLGVARESIDKKRNISLSPEDGLWTVLLRDGNVYKASTYPPFLLSLKEKPQKVGVFVDYEEGQVSFYDVEARSHIYSFTGCTFTEKLYPLFSPCNHAGGKNLAPLIISPVNHTDSLNYGVFHKSFTIYIYKSLHV
ncbi:unnamed protein product [Oncorhynchus mykiss]|uniref:E3 ubiquitin-protein ligase TRIM39-like n=1 Tax=Oncorhynchus mykiss TaxID=8022 RepID=A0A060WGI2_ONCMY|nr:unnamed protein product [Oncorhynchus mykiss]